MEKGEVDLCGVTGENEEETMGMKNRSGFSWREKPCLQMEPVDEGARFSRLVAAAEAQRLGVRDARGMLSNCMES